MRWLACTDLILALQLFLLGALKITSIVYVGLSRKITYSPPLLPRTPSRPLYLWKHDLVLEGRSSKEGRVEGRLIAGLTEPIEFTLDEISPFVSFRPADVEL
jgi:hypothetical protein